MFCLLLQFPESSIYHPVLEFKEEKPEGVTEDDVAYLWERKTVEDEETEKAGEKPELKELGKDKTYTVTQDDIGSKIVLIYFL